MPMIFVGGFIFHTLWEAKSQYVFSYFVILFPISLLGLRLFKEWFVSRDKTPISEKIDRLNNTRLNWNFSFTLAAAATVLVFCEVLGLATLRTQFPQDRALYKDYVRQGFTESWNPLSDGRYILTNGDTKIECELINMGDKTFIKDTDGSLSQAYKFYTDKDELVIGFNDDYILWYSNSEPRTDYVLYGTLMVSNLDDSKVWHFEKIG